MKNLTSLLMKLVKLAQAVIITLMVNAKLVLMIAQTVLLQPPALLQTTVAAVVMSAKSQVLPEEQSVVSLLSPSLLSS